MRIVTLVLASSIGLSLAACDRGPKEPAPASQAPASEAPAPAASAASAPAEGALRLGAPIEASAAKVTLADIAKAPASYVGKTFATTGTVTAVCQHKGCWMELKDDAGEAHVKMAGHAFFVPKTASGRKALILPGITLSLFQITLVMRLVRAEMLETMRTDFIRFARARGLKAGAIHYRHALRNCLMPVITVTGLQIGNLIAFALVTETVFQWPGMGLLFVQAVTFVDIPVMAAYLIVVSFIFVSLNTLVDLTYAWVDPRLREDALSGGANAR